MGIENNDHQYRWFEPSKRAILPLSNFHTSRRLRRRVRKGDFSASLNANFSKVIRNCGGRDLSWINNTIIDSYELLHEVGIAHSIEIYVSGKQSGGLYGVVLGGAFFGESMYSIKPMASQVALIHLVDHLKKTGFKLLDVQINSPHMKRFGTKDISAQQFQKLLRKAISMNCRFDSQPFDEVSVSALQRISQIS